MSLMRAGLAGVQNLGHRVQLKIRPHFHLICYVQLYLVSTLSNRSLEAPLRPLRGCQLRELLLLIVFLGSLASAD